MFSIPIPIYPDYHILLNIRSSSGDKQIIMTNISEEEEDRIDKEGCITLNRGKRTFTITSKQIYCYGEVNFKSKDDLNTIDNFAFCSHLGSVGIPIRSNYDYDTHSCSFPRNRCLWTETFSPARLAIYSHGCIGKPKRIVLFSLKVK